MKKKAKRKYYKNEPLIAYIGNKIRECQTLQGISIEKLAIQSDIDYTQLSRMELGKVNFSISILHKIAAALEVDAKSLQP